MPPDIGVRWDLQDETLPQGTHLPPATPPHQPSLPQNHIFSFQGKLLCSLPALPRAVVETQQRHGALGCSVVGVGSV